MQQFREMFGSMGASKDAEYEIAWIDISGPPAVAKVELFNWGGFRFSDYRSLFKHEDAQKVNAKVFDAHSQN